MSIWLTVILPIIGGALCSTASGLIKRYILKSGRIAPIIYLITTYGLATLCLATIYLTIWGWHLPPLLNGFWRAVVCGALVNVGIQFCSTKAASIDKGEVSLTAPLQAMTPGLITFFALTLGEFPGAFGIGGVIMMMIGSYILLWEKTPEHWLDYFGPFKRLRLLTKLRHLDQAERNKTIVVSLSMLSAFLGTFGLLFDGLYTRRANGMQGIILAAGSLTAILYASYCFIYALLPVKPPGWPISNPKGWSWILGALIIVSLLWVGHVLLTLPTFQASFIAYVGALKRFSVLFSVIAGYLFFGETDFKKRLWAGLFVVVGAILISFDNVPQELSSKLEGLGF